jgi:hypothetical protein
LGKKSNLNDIFHARKGHFAPGKRALGKTWGLPPSGPPGSYAAGSEVFYDLDVVSNTPQERAHEKGVCINVILVYRYILEK